MTDQTLSGIIVDPRAARCQDLAAEAQASGRRSFEAWISLGAELLEKRREVPSKPQFGAWCRAHHYFGVKHRTMLSHAMNAADYLIVTGVTMEEAEDMGGMRALEKLNRQRKRGITPDMADAWYTPTWLFDQIGLTYDIDVCAPTEPEARTCPATNYYTEADDGLAQEWFGLIWCNPPYSGAAVWIDRMADHNNGIALTHMPFNALWMVRAQRAASSARLIQTVEFVRPNGEVERPGYSLCLFTFGDHLRDALTGIDSEYAGPLWVPA